MLIDRYTKAVLTVIAAALATIAIQGAVPKASAMGDACGRAGDPCYVAAPPSEPVYVAASPKDPVYVAVAP